MDSRIRQLASVSATALGLVSGGGLVFGAGAAAAETAGRPAATVEELVVTAQARQERLQDVPLAVSAVTAQTLAAKAITNLEQLSLVNPGVKLAAADGINLIYIRGVGSGQNLATEQSVGTFVDGVYFGRDRATQAQLFDLQRVEVLKGPQVTLFGKNTIGGAFSIITQDPGAEAGGYLQGRYETELGSRGAEGAYSLPLNDKLQMRLAARYQDDRGWVDNSGVANGHGAGGAVKQFTNRLVVKAEPTDDLTIRFKVEGGYVTTGLDPMELTVTSPGFLSRVKAVDPSEDGTFDYTQSGPGKNPYFDQQYSKLRTSNETLKADWTTPIGTLTSITGHVGYRVNDFGDVDQSALSFVAVGHQQKYSSTSQELRIVSPDDRRLQYVGGLYYSSEDFRSGKFVNIDLATVGFVLPGVPTTVARHQHFTQKTKTWSAYVQGKYNLTDTIAVTAGLRETSVKKTVGDQSLWYSQLGATAADPLRNAIFPKLGLGSVHQFSGVKLSESNLSGLIRAEFRPESGVLYYAGYTEGYQAGGFDEDNSAGDPDSNRFRPEKVKSFELGMKRTLGRGTLNVDAFYNKITDLQVASFDGVAGFIVTNAAAAISRGVDVEFTQRLSDQLTGSLQASYLDAFYDSYKNAPAIFPASVQDLSGRPLLFSPKWTLTGALDHEQQINDTWTLKSQVSVFYTSTFDTTFNEDTVLRQKAFTKVDARLSLQTTGGDLQISLIGRNLTNKKTWKFGGALPLQGVIGINDYVFSDPPRTLTFEVLKRF